MLNRTQFAKLLKGGKTMDHGKKKKGMKKGGKVRGAGIERKGLRKAKYI